jgi:hypothetical protein
MGTALLSKGPLLFSKLDIKDGYWGMIVPKMMSGTLLSFHPAQA